ncbi:hypothetical protein EGC76_11200 [Pseudidiomarina gelatinasegens]|jgi:Flp pilus assembly protein TadB|uniref:Type II secretion system protein GspF domain-containing protein n=1 Tax=Pseudidiomarina gelatinasegens TaxID=2487740 RepID=A0A443YXQ6_9GAMM|nr:type II secretion system F family protein [Pseudidiomarina gelatinasegens]RWU08756.1 hypothetical protein EGC76_11200 [Pseudidiomarina gelatinasegens]
MRNELLLWIMLGSFSAWVAWAWLKLSQTLISNPRIEEQLAKRLRVMPEWFQEMIESSAQSALEEQSAARWLLRRMVTVVTIFLVWLLPITLWVKIGVTLFFALAGLRQIQRRKWHIRRALREWPSALDILAMLMHSGLSLRASIHAFQSAPKDSPAIHELVRVQRAQQSGYSLAQALESLSIRLPHPWVRLFVGAVVQAQATGGGLANTLQQQATQLRQQQLLEAEKRAQEVSVKLMFPLIFCFFPVTMLLILGPVFIGFTQGGFS